MSEYYSDTHPFFSDKLASEIRPLAQDPAFRAYIKATTDVNWRPVHGKFEKYGVGAYYWMRLNVPPGVLNNDQQNDYVDEYIHDVTVKGVKGYPGNGIKQYSPQLAALVKPLVNVPAFRNFIRSTISNDFASQPGPYSGFGTNAAQFMYWQKPDGDLTEQQKDDLVTLYLNAVTDTAGKNQSVGMNVAHAIANAFGPVVKAVMIFIFAYVAGPALGAAAGGGAGAGAGAGEGAAAGADVSSSVAASGAASTAAGTSIGGAISSGFETVLSEAGAGLAAVSKYIESALSGTLSQAGASSALGKVGSYMGTFGSLLNDVEALFNKSSGILGFLTNLSNLIGDSLSTIGHFAEEINTNIIDRFVRPITETIDTFKNLEEIIKGDMTEGLRGILKIPGQIADSLTNEAVIFHRTALETLQGQQHMFQHLLIPSFGDIASNGLSDLKDVISNYTKLPETPLEDNLRVNLKEPPDYLGYLSQSESFIDGIKNSNTWYEQLAYKAIQAMYFFPATSMTVMTAETQLKQNTLAKNPMELLGLGDIVRARIRGELSEPQATEEALKQGLDPSRLKLLHNISLRLIDPQSVIEARFRNILSPKDAGDELNKQGFTDDAIAALYELHFHLPPPNEAMIWFARTGLSQADLDGILQRNGLTGDQISMFKEAAYTPASGRIINASSSRIKEVENGYLHDSMGSEVPSYILDQYDKNLVSHEQADLDWMNHFDDLSMADWMSAYFRKAINKAELEQALSAHALPTELNKMYEAVSRELIPIWLVPGLYKTGQVTPEQSTEMLQKLGLDDANVKIMTDYGTALKDQNKATTVQKLHVLSKANLDKLYLTGIINKSEYIQGLEAHGYAKEDVLLLLELLQIKEELQTRKDYGESIIAEVNSGAITKAVGLEKLYSKGFTEDEINKLKVKLHHNAVIKYKIPGEAELSKMLKATIITPVEWIAAMQAHGYSLNWAEKLYELEEYEKL